MRSCLSSSQAITATALWTLRLSTINCILLGAASIKVPRNSMKRSALKAPSMIRALAL